MQVQYVHMYMHICELGVCVRVYVCMCMLPECLRVVCMHVCVCVCACVWVCVCMGGWVGVSKTVYAMNSLSDMVGPQDWIIVNVWYNAGIIVIVKCNYTMTWY